MTFSSGCRRTCRAASAPTIVQHYPDGDHGFMQRTGATNEAAIHLSTPQTIAFLKAALVSNPITQLSPSP